MPYTIRNAGEGDIPALLRLLTQVNMVHHIGRPDLFKGPATKYSVFELKAILGDARSPIFVCVDEGDAVLGYAFCALKQVKNSALLTDVLTLYVDDLCVDERCRGQGVGKALYRHVLSFARAAGCHNVTLNVWAFNESAIRFYESCGMRPQKIGMETIL